MADPLTILAGAALFGANETRKARKSAEHAAAQERDRLEALKKEADAERKKAENAMPAPLDEQMRRDRRRSIMSLAKRRGRQSTILTGNATSSAVASDSLGA